MYEVYLGTMLCPVTPDKIKMKIKGQNKTMNLINDGEINILKQAGLTDINFDLLLPNVKYPKSIARYESDIFKNAKYFLDILEDLKTSKKPFYFKITRTLPSGKTLYDTKDMKVSLEDYDITEDVKNGFDVVVSVKLKQFKDYGTKLVKIIDESGEGGSGGEVKASIEGTRSTENSPASGSNQSYTVVSGDCLWNIAKKFYGNGSKYTVILEANKDKIKNANLIYPGQILTIPAL
jgi:LysM repeat protein